MNTEFNIGLPTEDGQYLTVVKYLQGEGAYFEILGFANHLVDVDEYDFPDMDEHGWYMYDSEVGYFNVPESKVAMWIKLPNPKDLIKLSN